MSRDPWAAYWAAGGEGAAKGCLPEGESGIGAALKEAWHAFALELKPRARVLDLATGDGAVLRRLAEARRGLDLVGIDSAPALPPAPRGTKLRPSVAMEKLPFADRSFDAVTSQFGVEYGNTGRIAGEIARVLKGGGAVQLVVHHRDGAVVAHNRARRAAIAWSIEESGLPAKARALSQARAAAALPTPPAFRAAITQARALHPDQPVAAEVLTGLLQILELGRGRPAREAVELIAALEAKARDEIGRLDALEAAARDADGAAAIAAELSAAGLDMVAMETLHERPGGRAFAWRLKGAAPIS